MNYARPFKILIVGIMMDVFHYEKKRGERKGREEKKEKKKEKTSLYKSKVTLLFKRTDWFLPWPAPGVSRPHLNPQTCQALSLGIVYTVTKSFDFGSGKPASKSQLFSLPG